MSIVQALSSGPRKSKEIQALTGLSQASVSRQARDNNNIIRMPGPAPYRYAATKTAFDAGNKLPIATIDANGKNVPRAVLHPISPNGYIAVLLRGCSMLLAGESKNGVFEGLPYYLDDARPQGFLGKIIAQYLSEQSGEFSDNPDNWSEEQVGRYLIANGDDLPGDFVFGLPMMNRLRRKPETQTRDNYPTIADNTMAGYAGGTSAGGEQPKFTAFISDIESHVIVKFSPAQRDLTSTRWRDILVTEFHALTVLNEFDFTAAETRLFSMEGRYFLESKRFDRRGKQGRSSMFSLRTVDAEYTGVGGNWTDVANALYESELLSLFDEIKIKDLEQFGRLINNTDMHLGNLSLSMDGDRFSLLPAYDMCSMGFSPKGSEVTPLQFNDLDGILEKNSPNKNVLHAAIEFWKRVANDERSSPDLKEFISTQNPAQRIAKFV